MTPLSERPWTAFWLFMAGTLWGLFVAYFSYMAFSFDWLNDNIGLPLAETWVSVQYFFSHPVPDDVCIVVYFACACLGLIGMLIASRSPQE